MFKRLLLMLAFVMALTAVPTLRAAEAEHGTTVAGSAAGETAAAEGGHGGEHEAQPPLLPDATNRTVQLQALWVVIIFVALLMILYPTAWRNILAGLKKREERIRGDIAEAEAARKRAEATLAQYNQQLATAEGQVRDIIAKGSADAERIATSMKMKAQQEAEEAKERATKDIEAARKAAIADIYAQAAELSTNIAEKILKRSLNANDQRDLVAQSLEKFQTVGAK